MAAARFHLARALHALGRARAAQRYLTLAKNSPVFDQALTEKERAEADKLFE